MTYHEVHKLSRDGLSIRKIGRHLGLNWRTVKRLLAVADDRDYERYIETCHNKNKRLDPYQDFVLRKLQLFPDTSAAQMHDWLKEHYPDFPTVAPKTVFNFTQWIRQQHNLLRTSTPRACELVEETPYGAQSQVDFGVYHLRNTRGTRIKVYFFAMVLSRSRYKYVYFSLEPFTSTTAIDAHERAFTFFQGVPDTLVYDQDRVFMVDENKGDLLLTEAFRNYTDHRGFKVHFCRKADPQSKGKIENVIKYIKGNFLYNRAFYDINMLNQEAIGWLGRTANELPHGFTQKSPVSEWQIEKSFLRPIHTIAATEQPKAYTVRKDNSISCKGNFYSLPSGTYKGKGSKVLLRLKDNVLIFTDQHDKELCRHMFCEGTGQKIINNDHRRDKNHGVAELIAQFCSLVTEQHKALELISNIRQDKPRYIRDQLVILVQAAKTTASTSLLNEAINWCCEHHINSAADFKAIVAHLQETEKPVKKNKSRTPKNPLNRKIPDQAFIQPLTSSINDYNFF